MHSSDYASTSLVVRGALGYVLTSTAHMIFMATFLPVDAHEGTLRVVSLVGQTIISLVAIVGALATVSSASGSDKTKMKALALGWGAAEALGKVPQMWMGSRAHEIDLSCIGLAIKSNFDGIAAVGFLYGAFLLFEYASSLRFTSARQFVPSLFPLTAILLSIKSVVPVALSALALPLPLAIATSAAIAFGSYYLAQSAFAIHRSTRYKKRDR